jgi:hypothetical protein
MRCFTQCGNVLEFHVTKVVPSLREDPCVDETDVQLVQWAVVELPEYSTDFCVEAEKCSSIKLLYTYEKSLLNEFHLCISVIYVCSERSL